MNPLSATLMSAICPHWKLLVKTSYCILNPYLPRGLLQPLPKVFSLTLLNAILYPKMTSGHCFCIISAHYCDKYTHHPPRAFAGGRVVVQKFVYRGVGATRGILKKKKNGFFIFFFSFFFFFNPKLISYVKLFILRNFCHWPNENRMFLGFLWSTTNFAIFSVLLQFWRLWRRNDVTWKLTVLILVDMDGRDQ